MSIIFSRLTFDEPSTPIKYYIFDALGNPNLLCLLGSRMFINLIEAGQSDVKNGSGTGIQLGGGSAVSDIHFGDPSESQSSKYIPQDAKYISLTLIYGIKLYCILNRGWYTH